MPITCQMVSWPTDATGLKGVVGPAAAGRLAGGGRGRVPVITPEQLQLRLVVRDHLQTPY